MQLDLRMAAARTKIKISEHKGVVSPRVPIHNQALDRQDPISPPSEPVHLSAERGKGAIRLNDDGRS